jgi:purine nucleosidase
VTFTRADRASLTERTSTEGILLREVTRHIFDVRGFEEMALHDPLALLVAISPDLVTTLHRDVHVETVGTHTLGQTVVDLRRSGAAPTRNTRVCMEVHVERAKALFFEALRTQLTPTQQHPVT